MFRTKGSRALLLALAAVVTGWIIACSSGGDGGTNPPDDQVASVSVSPPQAELTSVGETVSLTARALTSSGSEVTGVSFTWSSSNSTVASVSSTGVVTARSRGTTTITARTAGVEGSAAVAVNLAVGSVQVSPSTAQLTALGQTVELRARAFTQSGDEISGLNAQWSSSAPDVASVNQQGVVTAQGNGPATIRATIEGVQGTAQITVEQVVDAVVLTPASASRTVGDQLQFSAEAQDANGNPVDGLSFTWASSNESVATVDQNGLATAVGEGSTMISATTSGGVRGTATLSVTREVASVEVSPGNAQLDAVGASVQFSAEAKDVNGEHIDGVAFTWSSSNGNVASVSSTGLATATGNGTAQIMAEADGVTGSATLVVEQVTSSVVVTPETASATVGSTVSFSAEARDANGNRIDGAAFQWRSGNEAVATVDQNGVATAQSAGSAQIIATSEGVDGSATLTVTEQGSMRIVSGDNQNGKTQRDFAQPLVVEVLDGDGNPEAGVTVTWSVVQGDATVSQTSVQTDGQGRAQVTLTSGTQLTTHRIQAAADGHDNSPVEFTARTTVLVALIGDIYFEDLAGRRNENFQVTVAVGDTIEFSYATGASTHTATSDSQPQGGQAFDSGNMQPGDTFRFVPGVTGTWTFFCEIHPGIMTGARIVVN